MTLTPPVSKPLPRASFRPRGGVRPVVRRRGLFVLVLALVAAGFAHPLDPARDVTQYVVEMKTTAHELPQNSAMAIVQTRDGYLWVGTYDGLARFDGVRFVTFDKYNTPALQHNSIHALLADRQGGLWIGTPKGLVRHFQGEFRSYTTRDGLTSDAVQAIFQDRSDRIWIGTKSGLNLLEAGVIKAFPGHAALSGVFISCLAEDEQGTLWAGSNGSGVYRLTPKGLSVLNTAAGMPSDSVWSLCTMPGGKVWAGTTAGVAVLDGGVTGVIGTRDGLPNADIRVVFRDRHGLLWLGTAEGDLVRFSGGRFRVLSLRSDALNRICSIMEDREGSLWVGTYRSGAVQVRDDKFVLWNSRNGLPVDQVRSVCEDASGNLWIGTVGGGIVRHDPAGFRVYGLKDGLANDRVWSIAGSPDGSVWFGTYGGGLHRLKDDRVTVYSTRDGLCHNVIRAVCVDSQGRVWVGTDGKGVDVLKDGKVIAHYGRDEGLSDDFIYAIVEDSAGAVWIGTYAGEINRVQDGKVTVFDVHSGLAKNSIWTIHPDADGRLWIGTSDGGLVLFRNGRFQTLTSQKGLFSDVAFQIVEDGLGYMWMNSNRGVYRVRKQDLLDCFDGRRPSVQQVPFGSDESLKGIPATGPAQPAGCRTRDGRIWFCSLRGVAVIDPLNITENPIPPPVVIERVTVNGVPQPLGKPLEVGPGKGNLEVQYTGLSFLYPERMLFKYRLDGFDPDWVTAGHRRSAYYTNLPPGRYTFRVTACNADRVWNPGEASFALELRPWFHQTSLFVILCVLAAVVAGWMLFRLRLAHLKRKAAQLQALVEERTLDLQARNNELETMDTIVKIVNRAIELDEVLHALLREAIALFPRAQKGGFLIFDESSGTFRVAASVGYEEEKVRRVSFGYDEAMARYTARSDRIEQDVFLIRSVEAAAAGDRVSEIPVPRSMLAMAVNLEGRTEGFLILDNMEDPNAFDSSDVRKLHRLREHAVSAINKARMLNSLAREKDRTLQALNEIRDAHEKLEMASHALEEAARTDPLTRLSNRRDIIERFKLEQVRQARWGKPFAVAMGDLDDFKQLNDQYGHDCGDLVLVTAAERMQSAVRRADLIGRWGGEEFLFIFPDTDLDGGVTVAEKIRRSIAESPVVYHDVRLDITITLGVCLYDRVEDMDETLKRADEALYEGKRTGKNRVCVARARPAPDAPPPEAAPQG
ncbi:MAG: diguanylate cyclase [Acidobacteria bacterium]|nr:diguanylate cyclase [Acidobacteriota bacterium]